jgi:heme exporter protein C
MQTWTQKLANPTGFMMLASRVQPWLWATASVLLAYGLVSGLTGAQDPDPRNLTATVKIMYVHVPSAWIGMMAYALVAASSFGLLVFRHPLADVSAKAAAPIGATFTFLALVTGALWGRPTWGTYWAWDARLTSVLILFILYLGLIALRTSIEEENQAAKLTAVLALVGVVILPFIKISVEGVCIPSLGIEMKGWNTLHQPSSVLSTCLGRVPVTLGQEARIDRAYFVPLIWSALGFTVLFFAMHVKAMCNEILRRRVKALQIAVVDRATGGASREIEAE